ncbi:hypothetical protein, partial [Vibrio breoganii]|uniref:hypothetical protein n=2 Tax=Vibrio breoganii TaxID=553239 RepID=UPI00105417E9
MLNLNTLKKIYDSSPFWLKNIYGKVPPSMRFGKDYRSWRQNFLKEVSLEEYRIIKLKESIAHSILTVPYYRTLSLKEGFDLCDFNEINDFKNFPMLDKDIIKENFNELISSYSNTQNTFTVSTGGSSGEPMKYLQSKNLWGKEWAFGFEYFERHGYSPSMLKASFRGGEFSNLKNNTYWKLNPVHNEIHFSPFHLNNLSVSYYVKELNRTQPKIFHGYPSSIRLLIECMINNN